MNLRTLMRCGDVTRWHMVRTARQQTVAEHLYKTWLLANELHTLAGLPESTREITSRWALTHDQPEILLGDSPTPTKRHIEQLAGDPNIWRRVEREVMIDHDRTFEDYMQQMVEGTPSQFVVKIADQIEGWHFITIEGIGPHAEDSRRIPMMRMQALAAQAQNKWPEYRWAAAMDDVIALLTEGKIEHVGM